jgi:hypothetical protein
MNLESGLMLGGALVSLGVKSSYNCWKNGRAKKFKAVKFGAVVMSCKTGKSRMCEKLKGNNKVLLVDVGESVERENGVNSNVNYLVKAKEYVNKLRKDLKDHSLLLVVSSIDEAKFLGVEDKAIVCLTPSNDLFRRITENVPAAELRKVEADRLDLISSCGQDLLNIFDSFDNLYNVIRTTFKLSNKF